MRGSFQFLPGTGRGTIQRSGMVVGSHCRTLQSLWAPSTAYGGSPPRAGEEFR
ncbi:MAG: hypothetical protein QOF05_434 [Sphingomonadales bacterium]|jgi:hypothetical protein|nr:hypothetical protein [Sphingomonadales bacterium]